MRRLRRDGGEDGSIPGTVRYEVKLHYCRYFRSLVDEQGNYNIYITYMAVFCWMNELHFSKSPVVR